MFRLMQHQVVEFSEKMRDRDASHRGEVAGLERTLVALAVEFEQRRGQFRRAIHEMNERNRALEASNQQLERSLSELDARYDWLLQRSAAAHEAFSATLTLDPTARLRGGSRAAPPAPPCVPAAPTPTDCAGALAERGGGGGSGCDGVEEPAAIAAAAAAAAAAAERAEAREAEAGAGLSAPCSSSAASAPLRVGSPENNAPQDAARPLGKRQLRMGHAEGSARRTRYHVGGCGSERSERPKRSHSNPSGPAGAISSAAPGGPRAVVPPPACPPAAASRCDTLQNAGCSDIAGETCASHHAAGEAGGGEAGGDIGELAIGASSPRYAGSSLGHSMGSPILGSQPPVMRATMLPSVPSVAEPPPQPPPRPPPQPQPQPQPLVSWQEPPRPRAPVLPHPSAAAAPGPVRNRRERALLAPGICLDCKRFYEAMGMPLKGSCHDNCSRHRVAAEQAADTPTSFWAMDFDESVRSAQHSEAGVAGARPTDQSDANEARPQRGPRPAGRSPAAATVTSASASAAATDHAPRGASRGGRGGVAPARGPRSGRATKAKAAPVFIDDDF